MSLIQSVEAQLHDLWAALEAEGHHLAAKAKAVLDQLKSDAPKLEAEAEVDAADVVKTAATEGVVPAEQEAVKDAGALAADAAHDVAAAVEGSAKTGETPSATA